MHIRAGRSLLLLCTVVVLGLGLGVWQVARDAPGEDPAAAPEAAAPRAAKRAPRARGSDSGGGGGVPGREDAGGPNGRDGRTPRLRAGAGDSVAAGDDATRVNASQIAGPAAASSGGADGDASGVATDTSATDSAPGAETTRRGAVAGRRGASGRAAPLHQSPGTLTIVVHAAESGAPLADVAITILVDGGKPETVAADALGRVVWRLDPGSTAEVRAHAPGRVIQRRTGLTVVSEKDTPVTFDLVRGVVVRGVVTRGEGVPVAGARVRAWTRDDSRSVMPLDDERFPLADVVTDRVGRYVVDALPRSTECLMFVEAAALATAAPLVGPEPDPGYVVRRDVALDRGVTFSGRVVDATRVVDGVAAPVAGARVLAVPTIDVVAARRGLYSLLVNFSDLQIVEHGVLDSLDWFARGTVWVPMASRAWRTRSGEDGKFAIPGCPADTKLVLMAFSAERGRSAPSANVLSSDTPVLALRGRQPVQFDVRVPRGDPAKGVEARKVWSWETWAAATLRDGLVGTPVLDVGVHRVEIGAEGYATNHYGCVVVPADDGPSKTLVGLRQGFTVTGAVVDDVGRPVPDAHVGDGSREVACAPDGGFTFDGLDAEWDRYLRATAPGHLRAWMRVDRAHATGVRVTLRRESVVTAALRCPDGSGPPAWRRVLVQDGEWDWSDRSAGRWRRLPDTLEWGDGAVRIDQLRAGTTQVAFVAPGMRAVVRAVTLRAGETTDLGVIDLVAATRIEGVVRDEAGAPVEGAEVDLLVSNVPQPRPAAGAAAAAKTEPADLAALAVNLPRRVAITGADGRFALDRVIDDANHVAAARAPDGARGTAAVAADPADPAAPVVIVVRSVTVRSGHVAAGGRKVEGALATWKDASDHVLAGSRVAADGTFETAVPGVPVRVDLEAAWGTPIGSAAIDPAADPSVPVEIALR